MEKVFFSIPSTGITFTHPCLWLLAVFPIYGLTQPMFGNESVDIDGDVIFGPDDEIPDWDIYVPYTWRNPAPGTSDKEIFNISIISVTSRNPKEYFSDKMIKPALEFAVKQALALHRINIIGGNDGVTARGEKRYNDTCDQIVSPDLIAEFMNVTRAYQNDSLPIPKFAIGPSCDPDVKMISQLALSRNLTIFTDWAPFWNLPDLSAFANRIGYSIKDLLWPILKVCSLYGWYNISTVFYVSDPANEADNANYIFQLQLEALENAMADANSNLSAPKFGHYEVAHNIKVTDGDNATRNLQEASGRARIIIFLMPKDWLRRYMVEAALLNYTQGDYAFFALDDFTDAIINNFTVDMTLLEENNDSSYYRYLPISVGDGLDELAESGYQNLFAVSVATYSDSGARKAFFKDVAYFANMTVGRVKNVTVAEQLSNTYDIIILIAGTVREMLDDGAVFQNGTLDINDFTSRYTNQTVAGNRFGLSCNGYFITANGDKKEKYSIWSGDYHPDFFFPDTNATLFQFSEVGRYDSLLGTFATKRDVNWLKGTPPVSYPLCGYLGLDPACAIPDPGPSSLQTFLANLPLILPLMAAAIVPVVVGLLCYGVRYRKYKKAVAELIAEPDDLIVVNPDEEHQTKRSKLSRAIHAAKDEQDGKVHETGASGIFDGQSFGSALSASMGFGTMRKQKTANANTGIWKKTMVTVRWCNKRVLPLTQKIIHDVLQVKAMNHDNLAVVIGVCIAQQKVLVIYDLCSRGNLQELIARVEEKFDWTVRIAFLEDILNGLFYLQKSSLACHGRLTSECCQIERRFVIRLSDYGLPTFFDHSTFESWVAKRNTKYVESQMWQAPEVLHHRENEKPKRSAELDVYSFGIILQEVILRNVPYSMYPELDTETLCRNLRVGHDDDEKPLRPFFPETVPGVDPELLVLAEDCWSEYPADRPKLSAVRETIQRAAGNMGIENRGSIMDMLLVQMDQQNNRLQAVVEEKCRHILQDKQKTDNLIALCLDSVLADQLKSHHKISPEAFEIVTVLQLQMSKFEQIVLDSTPAQLIDILNEFSKFIDDTITDFDCRKLDVEVDLITIASGVPKRNGILNAREICRLALTLQYRVRELRFHHRPNDLIKLQMGVHSGSCVAAVLGNKIPRYTIFGDTVDITKRMLLTGLPQMIHISSYTKDVLETFGSFKTEERGEVFVKGKGALTTYWLAGEDGNKELRMLQMKYEAALLAEEEKPKEMEGRLLRAEK